MHFLVQRGKSIMPSATFSLPLMQPPLAKVPRMKISLYATNFSQRNNECTLDFVCVFFCLATVCILIVCIASVLWNGRTCRTLQCRWWLAGNLFISCWRTNRQQASQPARERVCTHFFYFAPSAARWRRGPSSIAAAAALAEIYITLSCARAQVSASTLINSAFMLPGVYKNTAFCSPCM